MAYSLKNFRSILIQNYPRRNSAPITEANLHSQAGKVFIVTGGSSGIGYELARILHGAGAKVYILSRTEKSAFAAISRIESFYKDQENTQTCHNATRGSLKFIAMDLADLTSVRRAAKEFLAQKDGRLDVLFNNGGTGAQANAPRTAQGHECLFGTNVLGPFLLTHLLASIMDETAKQHPGSVRVVWAASVMVDMTPKGGMRDNLLKDLHSIKDQNELYSSSKAANWFMAYELMQRQQSIVHVAGNPGNYSTDIWRHLNPVLGFFVPYIFNLREPVHGAHTYMFMAFSDQVTMQAATTGMFAVNDGRWHPGQREDLLLALRPVSDGGLGRSDECYNWCSQNIKDFT